MSTYYKYARRKVGSQVDWSAVGKDMTDMLKLEALTRQHKKDELDAASRELSNTLASAPTGDYKSANEFALEFADEGTKALMELDRQLKSGNMTVRDYTTRRQNLADGTAQLFNLAKQYQDEYAEKMARWDGDESSYREVWEMEQVEGLANLRNSRAVINPLSYHTSVGRFDENGKLIKDPSSYATVNELSSRMKSKYNRFGVDENVANAVNTLGEYKNTVIELASQGGGLHQIITTVDAKKGNYTLEQEEDVKNYKSWEDDVINGMMVNPNDVASILTDFAVTDKNGKKFTFTYDEEAFNKDKSLIYIDRSDNNSFPKFHKSQEKIVKDLLSTRIRAAIDSQTQIQTVNRPYSPYAKENAKAAARDKKNYANLESWRTLYTGTNEEKQSAVQAILGIGFGREQGLIDIDLTSKPNTAIFRYEGGKGDREIPIDETVSLSDWMRTANEVMGIEDERLVNKALEGYEDAQFVNEFTDVRATRKKPSTVSEKFNTYVSGLITPDMLKGKSGDIAENLRGKISGLGFDIDRNRAYGTVTITKDTNKGKAEFKFKATDGQSKLDELTEFIITNMSTEDVKDLAATGILDREKSNDDDPLNLNL